MERNVDIIRNLYSGMEPNIRDTGSTVQNETRRNQREIRRMLEVMDGRVQRDSGNVEEREQLQRHRNKVLDKACGAAIGLFIAGFVMLVVLVFVEIKPALKDSQLKTAQCRVISSDITDERCSTDRCNSKEASNDKYVKDFRLDYGLIGDEFTCYYNPERLDEVFTTRPSAKDVKMTLVHSILWPSLVILLSVGIFTMYCGAEGYCCFKKKNRSAVWIS